MSEPKEEELAPKPEPEVLLPEEGDPDVDTEQEPEQLFQADFMEEHEAKKDETVDNEEHDDGGR